MKKVFSGLLICFGVIFLLFVVNIVLYSAVPGYKAALSGAVGKDDADRSRAEVITSAFESTTSAEVESHAPESSSEAKVNVSGTDDESVTINEILSDGSIDAKFPDESGKTGIETEYGIGSKTFEEADLGNTLADKPDGEKNDAGQPKIGQPETGENKTSKQPVIIDKEYHEDCGTGKGYWVITYSDGSTSIE